MGERRMLVAAMVTEVKDATVLYPGCQQCYAKMLLDLQDDRWWCLRCQQCCRGEELAWRYRLSLTVSDLVSVRTVVIFGGTLQSHFGLPATDFSRLLASNEALKETLPEALSTVFEGQRFIFGFRYKGSVPSRRNQAFTLSDLGQGDADIIALQMLCADGAPPRITVCSVLQRLCMSDSCPPVQLQQQQQQQQSEVPHSELQQRHLQVKETEEKDCDSDRKHNVMSSCDSQSLSHGYGKSCCAYNSSMPCAASHLHHCSTASHQHPGHQCSFEASTQQRKGHWKCTPDEHSKWSSSLENSRDVTFLSILAMTYDFREGETKSQSSLSTKSGVCETKSSQKEAVSSASSSESKGQTDYADAGMFVNSEDVLFLEASSRDIVGDLASSKTCMSGDEGERYKDVDCTILTDLKRLPSNEASSSKNTFTVLHNIEAVAAKEVNSLHKEGENSSSQKCCRSARKNGNAFADSGGEDKLATCTKRSNCDLVLPFYPEDTSTASARKVEEEKVSIEMKNLSTMPEKTVSCDENESTKANRQRMAGLCSRYLDMPESERLEEFLDKCFQSSMEESVTAVPSSCRPTSIAQSSQEQQPTYNNLLETLKKAEMKRAGVSRESDRCSAENFPPSDVDVMLKCLEMPESEKMDEFLKKCNQSPLEQVKDCVNAKPLTASEFLTSDCKNGTTVEYSGRLAVAKNKGTLHLERIRSDATRDSRSEHSSRHDAEMVLQCLDMPESEKFDDFLDKCFQSSFEESFHAESSGKVHEKDCRVAHRCGKDDAEIPPTAQEKNGAAAAVDELTTLVPAETGITAVHLRTHTEDVALASSDALKHLRITEGHNPAHQNLDSGPACSEESLIIEESILSVCEVDENEAEIAESFLDASKRNMMDLFAPTAEKIRRCISSQMGKHRSRRKEEETASPILPHRNQLHNDLGSQRMSGIVTEKQCGGTSTIKQLTDCDVPIEGPAAGGQGPSSQEDLFGSQPSQDRCSGFDGSVDLFDSSAACWNEESTPAIDVSVHTPECFSPCGGRNLLSPGMAWKGEKTKAGRQHAGIGSERLLNTSGGCSTGSYIVTPLTRAKHPEPKIAEKLDSCEPAITRIDTCRKTAKSGALNQSHGCGATLQSTPVSSLGNYKPNDSTFNRSFLPSQELFSPCDSFASPAVQNHSLSTSARKELPPLFSSDNEVLAEERDLASYCKQKLPSRFGKHLYLSHASTPKGHLPQICEERELKESPPLFSQPDLFSESSPTVSASRGVSFSPGVVSGSCSSSEKRTVFVTPSRVPLSVHKSQNLCRERDFRTPKMPGSKPGARRAFSARDSDGNVTPNLLSSSGDSRKEPSSLLSSMRENLLLTSTPSLLAPSEENIFSPDLF